MLLHVILKKEDVLHATSPPATHVYIRITHIHFFSSLSTFPNSQKVKLQVIHFFAL